MLKAVALVIPTYAMCCFKLSITLYSKLKKLMTHFWCGQKENERMIHWMGWDKMCTSKFQYGLGFKKLNIFNLTLLAK